MPKPGQPPLRPADYARLLQSVRHEYPATANAHGPERKALLYAMRKGVLVPVPGTDASETVYARAKRLMPAIAEAVLRIELEGGSATSGGEGLATG